MSRNLICLAAAFAMLGATACAEEPKLPPRTTINTVDQAVTYMVTAQALALDTRCGSSPAWRDYDRDALLAEYRTAQAYLEKYAPGDRIFADVEVNRFFQSVHNGVHGDDEARARLCDGLATAMVGKYRRQSR